MTLIKRGTSLLLLLAPLCSGMAHGSEQARQIGREPQFPSIWISSPPVPDYIDFVRSVEMWPTVASATTTIKLSSSFVAQAGDKTLSQIFGFLKKNNIDLALEVPAATIGADGCGRGVEGFRAPGVMRAVFEKIARLGGDLKYVATDEPLWFGHSWTRPGGCRFPVDVLARNVARTLAQARAVFPEVRLGDEEPVPKIDGAGVGEGWHEFLQTFRIWLGEYTKAVGQKPQFIHFDVDWFPRPSGRWSTGEQTDWKPALRAFVSVAREQGLRVGVFFNGDQTDTSDIEWTARAERRFRMIVDEMRLCFDDVIFQTWMPYPRHVVPEDRPGSLTNLVLRFLRSEKYAYHCKM